MANILQVTTPNLNTDNRNILNPQDPKYNAANQTVHNPVDPTRVVRADGRDGDQTGAQQDVLFGAVNYESNYGAFIKGLGENGDISSVLERLLFSDMAGLQQAEKTEVGALVERLLLSVRMDSPQELVEFMQGQREVQARFTGDFFNSLRAILAQDSGERLKDLALHFLKGYNDYSSGAHLLQQMRSLTGDIGQLLLRSYREEFQDLVNTMNWQAANGDTQQNAAVLNNRLIPFLASYIAGTHDYGPVREAAMLLVFHAVRYQNGEKKGLEKLFDNLINNRTFARLFKGDPQESLDQLLRAGSRQMQRPTNGVSSWLAELNEAQEELEALRKESGGEGKYYGNFQGDEEDPWGLERDPLTGQMRDKELSENSRGLQESPEEIAKRFQTPNRDFADGVANLLLKGANGQAGLENVQQFYTIMNGMLLNESVYMPLLHFILPFQYEGNNVMSEMWVDPDGKKDKEEGGRAVKLFLKFDIQGLGKFELLMTLQDRESRMQLLVPKQLVKEDKKIQAEVAGILKKNGIRYSQLMVRERVRDRRVDEVFPEIREKERTINVRI